MADRRAASPSARPAGLSGPYRVVWRWHFYAGVFVLPFLMLLSLTGAAYLFRDEIDHALYRRMIEVQPGPTMAAPDDWVVAAVRAGGGRAAEVVVPARPDQAVRIRIDRPDGESRTVFVDPGSATVTGVTASGGVMEVVKRLHSLSLFGKAMNIVVEIVAGWTVILIATGLFLWWPRGREAATLVLTARDARRRPFWRDLHALTGLYVGGVILFLAVTGMPWSAVWGDRVLGLIRDTGYGRPPAPATGGGWGHAQAHETPAGVGWTMENAVLHSTPGHAAGLSRIMATIEAEGLQRPFVVTIPQSPDLAWTAAHQTRKAEQFRNLYLDGHTAAVKADIGWRDLGGGARAFDWATAVHQGLQYGEVNRIIMLIGCIGVWVLAISGLLMWWKRRPPTRTALGAPPAPPGASARKAVLMIVAPLAVMFPLTGASLLAALAVDLIVRRARPG